MKKICIVLACAFLVSVIVHAEVKVAVKGDAVSIDTSEFPPQMRTAYELMKQKCGKCHSIERIVVAAQTGICPLSKTSFTKETTRTVVTRMLLKPDSDMTKSDARTIVMLLNYLLDQKVTVEVRK